MIFSRGCLRVEAWKPESRSLEPMFDLAILAVLLEQLSWPTGLAIAPVCRSWCAASAEVANPFATGGPPWSLTLWEPFRRSGHARTASTWERFEPGVRVSVYGAVGRWLPQPPVQLAGCLPAWEQLPEADEHLANVVLCPVVPRCGSDEARAREGSMDLGGRGFGLPCASVLH